MSVTMLNFHLLRSDLVSQNEKGNEGKSVRFGSMKVLAKICKRAYASISRYSVRTRATFDDLNN